MVPVLRLSLPTIVVDARVRRFFARGESVDLPTLQVDRQRLRHCRRHRLRLGANESLRQQREA